MKIGVLVFGYQKFDAMGKYIKDHGFFTANVGDNMQSLAIRMLLSRIGIKETDIISINRDELKEYSGPPVALVMNGVFYEWCFPLPSQIKPIFIGFHATESTILKNKKFFYENQPIGCRDRATADIFIRHGIAANVTGCLTLTVPRRERLPSKGKVLVVYGGGSQTIAGDFPAGVLQGMPAKYFNNLEFIYQRLPMFKHPLNEEHRMAIERYTASLLQYYAKNANLIITSLHHAAAPCIALGIPVIICRHAMDPRFSFLSEIIKVHTPDDFKHIDWNPVVANIEHIRKDLEELFSKSVSNALSY